MINLVTEPIARKVWFISFTRRYPFSYQQRFAPGWWHPCRASGMPLTAWLPGSCSKLLLSLLSESCSEGEDGSASLTSPSTCAKAHPPSRGFRVGSPEADTRMTARCDWNLAASQAAECPAPGDSQGHLNGTTKGCTTEAQRASHHWDSHRARWE